MIAVRTQWINWRMRDLPAVYQDLMPATYNVKVLMEAEAAIRHQLSIDLQHLENPWRQIGPVPGMLDSELSPQEQLQLAPEYLAELAEVESIDDDDDDDDDENDTK